MTHEIYVGDDGSVYACQNGTLDWLPDDENKESFDDLSDFKNRLFNLQ